MGVQQIQAVVFDVNETMIDMTPLQSRLQAEDLPKEAFQAWFAAVLRDGTTLAITDSFTPFKEVGAYHLRAMLRAANVVDADSAAQQVLGGFDEVMPHPDVEPGLKALQAKGIKAATMTNGSASITRGCLQRAGLEPYIVQIMDIAMVQRWKPHASVYAYAAKQLGLPPEQVMLIAVHPWDCHGAKAAGLRSLYLNRHDADFPDYFIRPDFTIRSLTELDSLQLSC